MNIDFQLYTSRGIDVLITRISFTGMSRLSQDNTFTFCSKGDSYIYMCVNYYDKQTTDLGERRIIT